MSDDKETTWPTLDELVGDGFPHGEIVGLHTSNKSSLLPLREGPFIYIDFETTGLPYSRADAAVSSAAFRQVASLLAKDPEEDA